MINDFDITDIEGDMIRIVRDTVKVSGNVYCNRPKSISPQVQEYVVVKVSGGVVDYGAYGTCYISVQMFARNVNNIKNGKKLSMMYQKLVEGLPASSGRYEFDTMPNVMGDTDDDFGFHCRIINLSTIIKVKQ